MQEKREENGSILASQVVTPWYTQAFSLYKLSLYRISKEEEDLEHYKNLREKSYKIQASNL